jgi:hypothetical protein
VYTLLNLSEIVPEKMYDIEIHKKLQNRKLELKGYYKNGKGFEIILNNFVLEKDFFLLLGFFAGEGSKSGLNPKKWKGMPWEITNSNPLILTKTIKIIESLGIDKRSFSPRIQMRITQEQSNENLVRDLTRFWSETLGISEEKFRKPLIRIKKTSGKSQHGTISLRINSAILGKLFNYWLEQLLR